MFGDLLLSLDIIFVSHLADECVFSPQELCLGWISTPRNNLCVMHRVAENSGPAPIVESCCCDARPCLRSFSLFACLVFSCCALASLSHLSCILEVRQIFFTDALFSFALGFDDESGIRDITSEVDSEVDDGIDVY